VKSNHLITISKKNFYIRDRYKPRVIGMHKECNIGKNTKIAVSADLYKCKIGDNCKISGFVYIEEGVKIGNNCKIRPFTFIPTGVTIHDGVFIGPGVKFINDKTPRAINKDGSLQEEKDWQLIKTIVEESASIGAGSTILCGLTVGKYSVIGAGSVVTKDVPDYSVVVGNPAKIIKEDIKW
jgi:UDP-2-acetamido-3-amino-2,3-dideoxy-glucuronate N-acetyltransferase